MSLELRDPANIGGRIAYVRELRKMNATELAKAVGISQPSMSDIEKGKTKSPNAIHLFRIAAVLAADPYWILTGEGSIDGALQDVEESELVAAFRALRDVKQRRAILAAAKAIANDTDDEEASGP